MPVQLRAPYEFRQAVAALTGMDEKSIEALTKKIDVQAPKEVITDKEITKFVADAEKGSKRLTAEEKQAAPALAFLKKALNLTIPTADVRPIEVEDMSKLKVPQKVSLDSIRGGMSLPTRQVIRGTGIGDILDTDTPHSKLHAFAKSLSADGKNLTLKELLKAQRDDHRGYDSYLQCNAILEKYFVGPETKGKRELVFKSAHMEVFSKVERSFDTYSGGKIDVNLRPNIEVKARPGDIVIIQSSLRHSEPEVAVATDKRNVEFPWWGDENKPSTMTVVIARPTLNGPPEIVDAVKLQIPVNVAHVKAAPLKPHQVRGASDG